MEDLALAAPQAAGKVGGTIRVGIPVFGASLEPYLLDEGPALAFSGIPGEYLTFTTPQGRVVPWLATSWKPNADATVWTFQIRRGVKFHNGQTMTAQDVVASMKQYVREKSSNAGLTPYSTQPVCPHAGSTPSSSGSSRRRRVPVSRKPDDLPGDHPAGVDRGPARYVGQEQDDRNRRVQAPELRRQEERRPRPPHAYWGGRPPLDGVRITFYQGSAPTVLALRAGQIDLVMQFSPQEARPFKNNARYTHYQQPTSTHRQVAMRTDLDPFKDPRVRRAVALVLDRPQRPSRVMLGAAEIGNDSPFWRGFPSTTVRRAATAESRPARSLLQAAGAQNLKFNLTTWQFLDHTDHAAAVQAYARQAGIDIGLEVMDVSKYYDAEPAGADYATTTPWLNRPATLTEYGARGVPNVYVTRCYMSTGDWNASHYKNPAFDTAARAYLSAAEVGAQRRATKRMARSCWRTRP